MEHFYLTVGDAVCGKIKKVNGVNLAPPINTEGSCASIRKDFEELHVPLVRMHDAPLDNPGLNLVDVNLIFPFNHLDPSDYRNYNFRATDDYLKKCIEGGSGIYYRLGCSIDHSINKYNIDPVTDVEKWVQIVSGIIDHYNYGWGNGFEFDIKYWEIWNEPEGTCHDLHTMWNAPFETFMPFFVDACIALKKRYPQLKFGGPSFVNWIRPECKQLLQYCAERNFAPDFFSFHGYGHFTGKHVWAVTEARNYLDSLGMKDTEIHFNEWRFTPPGLFDSINGDRSTLAEKYEYMRNSAQAATQAVSVMIRFQDAPCDQAYYYTGSGGNFGIFDSSSKKKQKCYYALKAFGDLAFFCPDRLPCTIDGKMAEETFEGFGIVNVLAARGPEFDTVLVSSYQMDEPSKLHFSVGKNRYSYAEIKVIDGEHNLETVTEYNELPESVEIDIPAGSSVFMIVLR